MTVLSGRWNLHILVTANQNSWCVRKSGNAELIFARFFFLGGVTVQKALAKHLRRRYYRRQVSEDFRALLIYPVADLELCTVNCVGRYKQTTGNSINTNVNEGSELLFLLLRINY